MRVESQASRIEANQANVTETSATCLHLARVHHWHSLQTANSDLEEHKQDLMELAAKSLVQFAVRRSIERGADPSLPSV